MKRWGFTLREKGAFVVGFVMAAVLLAASGQASEILQKQIDVAYVPLKYSFDGVEKSPPADQQGFIHNSRTFVSLRFAAESLGRTVDYDPQTYTVYVGRRPGTVPDIWKEYKVDGPAPVGLEYYPKGLLHTGREEINETLLVVASTDPETANIESTEETRAIWFFDTADKYKKMSFQVVIPSEYLGQENRKIARLLVMDDLNRYRYSSEVITSKAAPVVTYEAPIDGAQRVRLFVIMYAKAGIERNLRVQSVLGLRDLQFHP
ncbi:MAG: stalk domain-containing protein [Bacillota bacterium]